MQPTVEHLNMSKWYSSFSSSQRRNHNALSEEVFWSQRNDTFFTIAFSRWNILLSRGLVDPLPFPSSAGVSRWKSIFSLLEKPVTTLNSRSESPEWHQTGQLQLRTPSQMFHRGPGAVPTTAGDRKAPAQKLLCLSQGPQLQEHRCLLRPWNVPHPAVLRWMLPNGLEEDCWQHGDTNLGQLTTRSCLHTPSIGPGVLPLTLSSFLWLWVMSVSNPSYSNISVPYFSSSREDIPPSLLIVIFVFWRSGHIWWGVGEPELMHWEGFMEYSVLLR